MRQRSGTTLTAGTRVRRGDRRAGGMTLLEVLLAVLLLAMGIGVVMTAISAIAGMEAEGRKRLAAYEVANRIMLQFLDDEKGLPEKALAIEYGEYRFFWDLDKTGARMVINRKQESSGSTLQALDRFKLIGVVVYDAQQNGKYETKGEPIAFLSRVIDPAAPRNPDSLETYTNDMDKIRGLINSITGAGGADTGGGGDSSLGGRKLH